VTQRDPELMRLLVAELERHLAVLERDPPDWDGSRRSLHALKGSVGLAGEGDLAATLARLERRLSDDDVDALRSAAETVRVARDRLTAGDTATAARWPEPPAGLEPSVIDPSMRAPYSGEVGDRLAGIDEALGGSLDPEEAAKAVYRHVHTMKGAASSVGDELMAWFCHGLEDRLRGMKNAAAMLQEVARWRGVLGGLLDDPAAALRTLKSSPRKDPRSNAPRRETDEPPRSFVGDETTIRVATVALDRVLERVDTVTQAQESYAGTAEHDRAATLRRLRADLAQALRAIGPPRPWGAPAAALHQIDSVARALDRMSEDLEVGSAVRRAGEQSLRESLLAAKRDLYAMRQARLGGLFARLATAIEAEGRRAGRSVVVDAQGGSELVDRRIVEQLIEPCLQLARNAVAHGIEAPAVRAAQGKSEAGTITIQGRRHGSRLHVIIEDDGAGVDVAVLRQRAIESGAVSREVAEAVPDDTLLGLLFLPGFSMRDSADLLAGRGIGLDIALAAVQRMAGALRVSSRKGKGFRAVVEVPIESGLAKVLWVRAGAHRYALFASYVRAVEMQEEGAPASSWNAVPHLASCLEPDIPTRPSAYVLELDTGDERVTLGVDEVGRTEDHVIRPLTPLLAAMGPFLGAIVRSNDTPALALDAYALASRIRTQAF
jgi:chemotaxis protein histidine kinase CheA